MRVLELGKYVAPAYAGLILAEQGHAVTKLLAKREPTLDLHDGEKLFEWLTQHKTLLRTDVETLDLTQFDAVVDNIQLTTWQSRVGVTPEELSEKFNLRWVSIRSDTSKPSFDLLAQNQAWGDKGSLPFYIGDTAAGLWAAFKLLNLQHGEHAVVYQSTALAKLVEGNLYAPWRLWDEYGTYYRAQNGDAVVMYGGETFIEPPRDDEWRREHLRVDQHGNFIV